MQSQTKPAQFPNQFSAADFRQRSLDRVSRLTLVAAVSGEGDHLIIEPYPCSKPTFYRVPAHFVSVSENPLEFQLPNGMTRTELVETFL